VSPDATPSAVALLPSASGSTAAAAGPPADRLAAAEDELVSLVRRGLQANTALNLAARVLLALFALTSGALALLYVHRRGDQLVQILREPDANGDLIGADRLLALSMPVVLFVLFAALAGAAAWILHARGQDEVTRTVDAVSRLKREGEAGVSARGLVFASEEKLGHARRAFGLLLWLGRTLFVVCLGLFATAVANAIVAGVDLLTVVLGAGSLAGSLLAVASGIPATVRRNLADVVQVQSIVTGCDRQINLLESNALAGLKDAGYGPDETHRLVLDVQERMDAVVRSAVELIQAFADPSGREPAQEVEHGLAVGRAAGRE
jgi:hypothetical protein